MINFIAARIGAAYHPPVRCSTSRGSIVALGLALCASTPALARSGNHGRRPVSTGAHEGSRRDPLTAGSWILLAIR